MQRRKHIRCAYWRLVQKKPAAWIALQFRVSPRTVFLWVEAARGYDDPEALMLKSLIEGAAT